MKDTTVLLTLLLVSALILTANAATASGQTIGGSWIWYPVPGPKASYNAPAGRWYFRRGFVVPNDRPIKSAACRITADNDFVLFINGRRVGSGDDWQKIYSFDVRKFLAPAKSDNVLAVEAKNWDAGGLNPAGLIARLRVEFTSGKPLLVRTDAQWLTSAKPADGWQAAGFSDAGWKKARRIGPFVSNRGNSYTRCVVGHPSTVLARCEKDGKNIYFISAGNEPEYTPALMPNGRVLYTRWEYTDKELMRVQSVWTVNPDGTGAPSPSRS